MTFKQNLSQRRKRKKPAFQLYAKCREDSDYIELVELLFLPGTGPMDPFWDYSIRAVLIAGLKKYAEQDSPEQGSRKIAKFYTFLKTASSQEYEDFFKETVAAPYTSSRSISPSLRALILHRLQEILHIPRFLSSDSKKLNFKHRRNNHEYQK